MQLSVFFFNDTATTEIYTLSLHDALPIFRDRGSQMTHSHRWSRTSRSQLRSRTNRSKASRNWTIDRSSPKRHRLDRKSTRLNSSHANISYAVFCLKKKKIYSLLQPASLQQ